MDIWGLKVFKAVVEQGTISKAALTLNCVQSNVTARIKQLEQELDVTLFYRKSRGVVPTAKGEILIEYADNVMRLMDDAMLAVSNDEFIKGPLSIGTMESTAAVRLPSLFAMYHENYPDVELKINTGTTQELVKQVLDYSIDAAFIGGPIDHPDIEQHHAFDEQLVIITEKKITSLSKLDNPTFIVFRKGCLYRNILETWARENGIIPKKIMELGTLEGILGFVNAGMGITVFPHSVVSNLRWENSVQVHKIPKKLSKTTTLFIYRKDRIISKALKAIIELLSK